jgi:hypothetical protein
MESFIYDRMHYHFCSGSWTVQSVRSTSLFKLENRNWTSLVQKPNWTRFVGKSENVCSGTRTYWLFRDQTNRKSVYRSTHFHFCPLVSVQFGFCTNLVQFRFSSLNKSNIRAGCQCRVISQSEFRNLKKTINSATRAVPLSFGAIKDLAVSHCNGRSEKPQWLVAVEHFASWHPKWRLSDWNLDNRLFWGAKYLFARKRKDRGSARVDWLWDQLVT